MNTFLYYIKDHLVGTHYFIYAFILLFLMFSIIGYLFKQKYGKVDIKLDTSQEKKEKKLTNIEVKTTENDLKKETQAIRPEVSISKDFELIKQEPVTAQPTPQPANPNVNNPTPVPTPSPTIETPVSPQPIPNTVNQQQQPETQKDKNMPIPEL